MTRQRSSSQRSYDPTHTVTLRKRFVSEVNRRYRTLRGVIRKAIIDEDGFGLRVNAGQWSATYSADRVSLFMQWLREQVDLHVLEVYEGEPRTFAGMPHWSSLYVREGYERGVVRGMHEVQKLGLSIAYVDSAEALMRMPFHMDRVGLLYTRTYNELRGVTEAMAQDIARTLAEGMAKGLHPYEIAKVLNRRVEAIGLARSRLIARTEIIRAHHQANILTYREAGVEGVKVIAEWLTAGDDRVCSECAAMEGKRFTLDEIEPLIPLHPNCRCVALPVTPETENL